MKNLPVSIPLIVGRRHAAYHLMVIYNLPGEIAASGYEAITEVADKLL